MLRSMTSFGRARKITSDGGKDITVEIKSVNSRYLDCSVRITRAYSYLEEKIKSYLSERGISRGKVEVYVSIDVLEEQSAAVSLDSSAAESYIAALKKLRDEFSLKDDISTMSVAQNRELFKVKKPDEDADKDFRDLCEVLEPAVHEFIETRQREGEALVNDILGKIETIKGFVQKIKEYSEADISGYPERLKEKIKQLLDDFDVEIAEQRILTEAAIFADKASIDEEIVRLSTHFESFVKTVHSTEPAGRKLDFMLQEINRETNTIGSKANNIEISRLVVEIKAELEKIREQIQNIE